MKIKNEVTGNLLLGCTVLRITPEFPGGVTIFFLEHAAGMPAWLPIPAIILELPWNNKCLKMCAILSLMQSLYIVSIY